jgi:hypothetical protein
VKGKLKHKICLAPGRGVEPRSKILVQGVYIMGLCGSRSRLIVQTGIEPVSACASWDRCANMPVHHGQRMYKRSKTNGCQQSAAGYPDSNRKMYQEIHSHHLVLIRTDLQNIIANKNIHHLPNERAKHVKHIYMMQFSKAATSSMRIQITIHPSDSQLYFLQARPGC